MLHVVLYVLVVESCPLLCRNNSVESTAGLDFELGVFVRALMCRVWDSGSVPEVYDLSSLFKVREEGSYKLLSMKECGFNRTLAIHLGVGGLSQSSVFYAACRTFYCQLIRCIASAMTARMDQCWSTAMLHPTLMKFGSLDRLREMMLLCLSKFCDKDKIGDVTRGRIEKSYTDVVNFFRKKWENETGPPVVDDLVKFWCGLENWKKYGELHLVVSTLLSSTCHGGYRLDFVDGGCAVAGNDSALSALHCVRSWFARDGGSFHQELTPEVVRGATEAIMKYPRFTDETTASPWHGLCKFSRTKLSTCFLKKWDSLDVTEDVRLSQDVYRSALVQEFQEARLSPKKGGKKKQKTDVIRGERKRSSSKPVTEPEPVVPAESGGKVKKVQFEVADKSRPSGSR